MAKRSSLYIRIVEGKNLPAKDINGSSDPYCIVKVDNEPIIRTATVWKTLCPFWGEEYQVHLPPTFHTVAFYVMDEDALSRDDVIGKVCLPRDTLASHPKGKFSLSLPHWSAQSLASLSLGDLPSRLHLVSSSGKVISTLPKSQGHVLYSWPLFLSTSPNLVVTASSLGQRGAAMGRI
ncbi:PREDICTED: ras GTPase-activating protein 4-like [Cercocebus atys]|uniref:ras GTPase-activating protein 4-like n=1 Tax=Cercocebus atys TaxID=9531 RepID=UPI0005F422B5|nr:PREDICTED: ras GTPase-activating protein 4-like [Cercocebus atys]